MCATHKDTKVGWETNLRATLHELATGSNCPPLNKNPPLAIRLLQICVVELDEEGGQANLSARPLRDEITLET